MTRDLARNEEFSEIAVINIFFTVLKKKNSHLWGGFLQGKFRDKSRNSHVNKQERYTSILRSVPIHCPLRSVLGS